MEIYIVIIEDRHADSSVHPFTDKDKAISEARRVATEYCRFPEDYREDDTGKGYGWLFYASYSCESDSVRVVTANLDEDI